MQQENGSYGASVALAVRSLALLRKCSNGSGLGPWSRSSAPPHGVALSVADWSLASLVGGCGRVVCGDFAGFRRRCAACKPAPILTLRAIFSARLCAVH